MKAAIYIVVGSKRKYRHMPLECGTIRVTKTKPSTDQSEIALKIDLDIPDALFEKPTLEASITVPSEGPYDSVITAEVMDNIAEIIKAQTGLTVTVKPAQDEVTQS